MSSKQKNYAGLKLGGCNTLVYQPRHHFSYKLRGAGMLTLSTTPHNRGAGILTLSTTPHNIEVLQGLH